MVWEQRNDNRIVSTWKDYQKKRNGRNYCVGEEVVIQKEPITVGSLGSSMTSYKGGPLRHLLLSLSHL